MLAFMATPELNCPPPPKGEPGIGVFIIERAKFNAPLSRSLYRLQTLSKAMLLVPMLPSLSATAWVQLAGVTPPTGVVPYAGLSAPSKHGVGFPSRSFPAHPPPAKP